MKDNETLTHYRPFVVFAGIFVGWFGRQLLLGDLEFSFGKLLMIECGITAAAGVFFVARLRSLKLTWPSAILYWFLAYVSVIVLMLLALAFIRPLLLGLKFAQLKI